MLSYRGYLLTGDDDIGYLISWMNDSGNIVIDSAPNFQAAKDLIDSWLNAV